eukprot:6336460-Prymnesium_polylepis.1
MLFGMFVTRSGATVEEPRVDLLRENRRSEATRATIAPVLNEAFENRLLFDLVIFTLPEWSSAEMVTHELRAGAVPQLGFCNALGFLISRGGAEGSSQLGAVSASAISPQVVR